MDGDSGQKTDLRALRAGGVTVREAEAADWAGIGAVTGRSPEESERLRRELQRGYDPCLVYVAEGATGTEGVPRIVGMAVAGVPRRSLPGGATSELGVDERREARLLWIEVLPSARRRGIGSALQATVTDELRARQFNRLALLVDAGQFEALALFQAAGLAIETESIALVLPEAATRELMEMPPAEVARVALRPLALDDVPHTAGLLIELGVERAETQHDELPALTPSELGTWLQRASTVAYGAWEERDPETPLGVAWASRRGDDIVLRFVGVGDDVRRLGIGRALVGALANASARSSAGGETHVRPMRARVVDPAAVLPFFRALGFESEGTTYELARAL